MPAPTVTQAAIKRAIEATKSAGLAIIAVTVSKDGTVRVETGTAKEVDSPAPSAQICTPKKWAKG